jgi:hypothetical protein
MSVSVLMAGRDCSALWRRRVLKAWLPLTTLNSSSAGVVCPTTLQVLDAKEGFVKSMRAKKS